MEPMAAIRDHSWYMNSRGRGAYSYHVIREDDKALSACGVPVVDLDDDVLPLSKVPLRRRCQRPGCRVRWPS